MVITWDEARFAAAGLTVTRDGAVATFYTAAKPDAITVQLIGDDLQFIPRRSSGHRRVLAALGINDG